MMFVVSQGGKLGIDNVKIIFSLLLSIYSKVKNLIKDFSFGGVLDIGIEVIKHKDDLPLFKLAWEEIKDLKVDDGELQELTLHLTSEAERLGLAKTNIMVTIQEALLLVTEIFELYDHGRQVYEKGIVFIDRIRSIQVKEQIQSS